jgi:hypothetical protein
MDPIRKLLSGSFGRLGILVDVIDRWAPKSGQVTAECRERYAGILQHQSELALAHPRSQMDFRPYALLAVESWVFWTCSRHSHWRDESVRIWLITSKLVQHTERVGQPEPRARSGCAARTRLFP